MEKRTIPPFGELVDFCVGWLLEVLSPVGMYCFVLIEYIIHESLGMMSVFVLIGYEIGPEMGLRIRIFFWI